MKLTDSTLIYQASLFLLPLADYFRHIQQQQKLNNSTITKAAAITAVSTATEF